ncbi:chromatin modification-related protein eaf-1-like isoform X1 [Athalia rosae]|uniref:chromatin modification-related protein eaf-1-like isoform X1 n=1 Tax=Athalia rosae TaxID=37344 RepID=UPI002033E3B9|nr:chromatin modification-related protein eaf-1-like isoform X1 [Athalia rosae]
MAGLRIFILSVLPLCMAQFSIQGPSDGNRAAQSLRYSEDKGIEYSDPRESEGAGDFSIQGATDGNSNFHIQGASDGNADFQIQGATDGNANFQIQGATDGNANFHIQGATDGNEQSSVQGPTYNGNQGSVDYNPANLGGQRSLQYNDPNGFKLNWRSFAHGHLSPQPQQPVQPEPAAYTPSQSEARYAVQPASPRPAPQPAPRPTHRGTEPPEPPQQPISYRPFDNAPDRIKQLLQFQLQIPYLNAIPEHLRYDALAQNQAQPRAQHRQSSQEQPREAAPPPTQYRPKQRAGHQRSRRQAERHPQQQQQNLQQYKRIPQPAPERLPQYSPNVPAPIKQLLQFQSQIPYLNAIPEQFRYNLDTVPAPVEPYRSPAGSPQHAHQGDRQRSKRQAHQQSARPNQQQQQHHQIQQQYKRIPQPAAEPQPNYSPHVPPQIKQLLQFQSQIPYVNAIPEQFRYNLDNAQHAAQNGGVQEGHRRGKRQAQQHQGQVQPQQQYRRISQPAPEAQPQYSTNLPSGIRQILEFQAQTPHNIIANQIIYRPDKPYVPQPVATPNYNAQANYQGRGQPDVRPVTEH